MFQNCKNLGIVEFPKFGNKLDVGGMFKNCDNLKNVYPDDENEEIRNEVNKLKEGKNKKIKKNTKKKKK